MALVPRRLVAMVGMAAFFVAKYYVEHCDPWAAGVFFCWEIVCLERRFPLVAPSWWVGFGFEPVVLVEGK